MLEKSFGLLFFLKQPKNPQQIKRTIYLRVTVEGIPKECSTKRQWYLDRWEQRTGKAIGTREDARSVNSYLDTLSNTVYAIKKDLLDRDVEITSEEIIDLLNGNKKNKKMIMEVFQEHNDQMKKLIGIDFSEGTHERYETSYAHT